MIAHWDEVERVEADVGPIGFDGFDLGEAAGTRNVGVTRALVRPGRQSSPVHVELDEEEIFYVLGGAGVLWQDGATHDVRAGDCIVHRVAEDPHALVGGADGLDVLAFGERTDATATWLPRPRVVRMGVSFHVPEQEHPWDLEAAQGALELPSPTPRPANVVSLAEVEDVDGWRNLGRAAGSVRTGLKHVTVPDGQLHAPPHCHSAEEEIFVVLGGTGTLELTPSPQLAADGVAPEAHPVCAGSVVSRPPGTRVAHAFRGEEQLVLLAYGTKDPNDMTYYPRSSKISFRGLGVVVRVADVAYEEGEESPY